MSAYEQLLTSDTRWALNEGGLFFEGKSRVHQTVERIARRLTELEVPYAVAGGMALVRHGYARFTEDVDLLVTRESLQKIHESLAGLGYRPPFEGSRHLRDADTGVKVEFIVTGDFPGDGKPKPVAFPDPRTVSEVVGGVTFLQLETLVELKLASGMTNAGRLKDLADVQELIKIRSLPRDFSQRLHPFVQEKFIELWDAAAGHHEQ